MELNECTNSIIITASLSVQMHQRTIFKNGLEMLTVTSDFGRFLNYKETIADGLTI